MHVSHECTFHFFNFSLCVFCATFLWVVFSGHPASGVLTDLILSCVSRTGKGAL
uniref:Uncharacterized protein n=1 Tax=Octopus bimaculoides TaxID=37653 RepID=A0A0L8GW92_OCTBM